MKKSKCEHKYISLSERGYFCRDCGKSTDVVIAGIFPDPEKQTSAKGIQKDIEAHVRDILNGRKDSKLIATIK